MNSLRNTHFHPQWFASGGKKEIVRFLKAIGPDQNVIDIGCFDKWPSWFIGSANLYVGLDSMETASNWYKSILDLFGDAVDLPILNGSVDVVILLDILEHIPDTRRVLSEACRVLKVGGTVLVQMPFLYSLQVTSRDYTRLTCHDLEFYAKRSGFTVDTIQPIGHPAATAVLLANLSASRALLNWVERTRMAIVLALLLLLIILFTNLFAYLVSLTAAGDDFMPDS